MVESELLKERVGQRIDVRSNKGQIRRLRRQIDNGNQTAFNRQWRNEFMNLDASDFSNEKYGELLQSVTNSAVQKGWLEGSGGVFSLSAGMTSAGTVDLDPEVQVTPDQSSEVSDSDISTLNYLSDGGSVLKFGSAGSKVTALQNILNARLQSHGKEDRQVDPTGTFDSATKVAVETMQGVYGIQVDGIVGRQTWVALKSDGAERAAVTPRAETAPADGAAAAADEEEAAAAAAAAASPAERPEKPGPMFIWDSDKNVWYALHNHYYYDEDPDNPIYQLWIVKDDEDFHVKLPVDSTWANITQSDIDSLETEAMAIAAAEEAEAIEQESEAEVAPQELEEPADEAVNESYSLTKALLLEFNSTSVKTDNNSLNTDRNEVGRGTPILTLEEQAIEISERIVTFKNEIIPHANAMSDEGNKGFLSNSDEEKGLEALAAFDALATELYDNLSDKIKQYEVAGGTTRFDESPSKMLAVKTGWQTIGELESKMDSFLGGDERATMLRIVARNDFPLVQKAREVVVSSDPEVSQEEINAVNASLEELMKVIEFTAVVIAANSYDTRVTWGGAARMIGTAASYFVGGPIVKGSLGALKGAGAAMRGGAAASRLQRGGRGLAHIGQNASTRAAQALGRSNVAIQGTIAQGGRTAALAGAATAGVGIGGTLAAISGVDQFTDGADETVVVSAINDFDAAATQFYIDNANFIEDNNIELSTPSALLLRAYQQNVTETDSADTVEEMISEMDEFLALSNYDIVKTQIDRNNMSYSQYARQNLSESFTFDRFTKLAGLLKG